MNVLRHLTSSKDDNDRELIKKRLEDCQIASDNKLTKLVLENHEELRSVMQAFTKVSDNLQSSVSNLNKIKQRLEGCREVLISKLEELQNLSEESRKNEKILHIINQVDDLKRVPSLVNELLDSSEYLKATKLLVEKQKYIEDNFEFFDCLKDIGAELESKREEIYRILREKLLYIVSDDPSKEGIIESLNLIDKTPKLPDLVVDKTETTQVAKPSLFKFSLSSHAICFNEHYKEQIEVTKNLLAK